MNMRLKSSQFANLDLDQALIHIKGMWMIIVARGGISTLEINQDLMSMISWYDFVTQSLYEY